MASRFVVADNDVVEELKTSSKNSNTGKSTNLWVGVFKKWAALRKIGEDMETYEVQEVDKFTINLRINFALYESHSSS
jgi:head-tail adaptor